MSHEFTWQHAQESFSTWSRVRCAGDRIDSQDPDEE